MAVNLFPRLDRSPRLPWPGTWEPFMPPTWAAPPSGRRLKCGAVALVYQKQMIQADLPADCRVRWRGMG